MCLSAKPLTVRGIRVRRALGSPRSRFDSWHTYYQEGRTEICFILLGLCSHLQTGRTSIPRGYGEDRMKNHTSSAPNSTWHQAN